MANGSGVKTNEREGTRAQAKYIRISAYKVREVLDLIRGEHVQRAAEILRFTQRDAAHVVGKVLASAVANAENNDGLDPDDLYVSTAYADEGVTLKRFRPRARGRAGRIRKRTCHITIIVSRMPEEELRRFRAKQQAEATARRARRVAGGRAAGGAPQAEDQGRGGRFRRNRGRGGEQAAAPTTDEQVETEELIEDDQAADVAEEIVDDTAADAVAETGGPGEGDSSADAGESTDEPAEGSDEAAPDEGADRPEGEEK
jgi:large subunit ribosomal protein L22